MKYFIFSILLIVLLFSHGFAFPAEPAQKNNRPVVGVLTQPSLQSLEPYGSAYIAASYVKYIESGGAEAVPIFYNGTKDYLQSMFQQINGLLFPGGGADIGADSQLFQAAQFLFQLAIEANDKGDYFPVAGHCLGYEILSEIISNNFNILSSVDAENISLPLHFVPQVRSQSRLFSPASCPQHVFDIFQNQAVTMNNHQWAVTPDDFQTYMGKTTRMLSVNYDRNGKEFVSTFEMIDYPVWAIQWHAEKPIWEWNPSEGINHSADAIEANSWLGRYTGRQARNSLHTFETPQIQAQEVIYNYCPLYTEALVADFEQCYMFGPPSNDTNAPPAE